jgi:hypothetical protein
MRSGRTNPHDRLVPVSVVPLTLKVVRSQMLMLPVPGSPAVLEGQPTWNVILVPSVTEAIEGHPPSALASTMSPASVPPPPPMPLALPFPPLLPVPLLPVPLLLVPLLPVPLLLVPLLLVLSLASSPSGTTLPPDVLLHRAALATRKAIARPCDVSSKP